MLDLDKIIKVIVTGLREHLGISVIASNQTGKLPKYPFASYTITTLLGESGGTWGKYEDGKDRKPVYQTWSITVQSDDEAEAMSYAIKAREWLDYVGKVYLNDNGVIVTSLTGIGNRDNMLTIEYEHRNGFDVRLWFLSEVEDVSAAIGTIEKIELGEVEAEEENPNDHWAKLQKRLGGDL